MHFNLEGQRVHGERFANAYLAKKEIKPVQCMKLFFEATIYKVGINPCVKVPLRISDKLVASKGYIPVKGKMNGHLFQQTLVPVKNEGYRLYVNGPMLKGSDTKTGDTVKFTIEQDTAPRTAASYPMPKELMKALKENQLLAEFTKLAPYRQKEVLKYVGFLKTKETLIKNIDKVINQLKAMPTKAPS